MLIQWRASSHLVVVRSSPSRGRDDRRSTVRRGLFERVALTFFDFGKC
jgi:hypothetical protein